MARSGLSFQNNIESPKVFDKKLRRGIKGVMKFTAPKAETHMKHHAPWTDRTTNARNGLAARAEEDGDRFFIVLSHSVFYGIFLEKKDDGKYAIILPTIEMFGPKVSQLLNRLMDRI